MKSRYTAIIGLVLTSIFWSGNIYVSKILLHEVSPMTLNLVRWALSVVVLTPFALKLTINSLPAIRQSIIPLTILGFLSVTVFSALLYSAAYTTEGINMALISTLTPLLTFVIVWIFLGQAPNLMQSTGFLFGFVGVLLLLGQGSTNVFFAMQFRFGDILMLLAVFSWSVYTVYVGKKPKGLSPLVFLYITTVLGVVMAVPAVIWEWQVGDLMFVMNATNSVALIYVGIFPSILSHLFFNYGVEVLGAQSASLCSYLLPIFTALIAILFLGESIQLYHVISQALVFVGLFLALSRTK